MHKKEVGQVVKVFISIKDENNQTKTILKDEISLDTQGVQDDKFYSKDSMRSILLSSLESYDIAEKNNIAMPYGSLGENILMDYNPYHLNVGDQLQIGEVILEITQNCTLCKGLSKIDTKAPKLLKEHRGIFAKAITNGTIQSGESVYI